jgi:glutathione S-transferase
LQLPYELEIFHRNEHTHFAPPELKKVHALGKSPVISLTSPDSSEPVIIAESAFIVEYLLDHFAEGTNLLPKRYKDGQEGKVGGETEEWLRFRYFMHYAEGSLMSNMMVALLAIGEPLPSSFPPMSNQTSEIRKSPVPFFIKPITSAVSARIHSSFLDQNFKTHFSFLEEQLNTSPEGGNYLCGPHLTGADILLSFPLLAGRNRKMLTPETYPKLSAYISRLEVEPGYKKAAEKITEIEGKFEVVFDS